jgi:hypothetical protein
LEDDESPSQILFFSKPPTADQVSAELEKHLTAMKAVLSQRGKELSGKVPINLNFQKYPLRYRIQKGKIVKFETWPGQTFQRFSVSFPATATFEKVVTFLARFRFYCHPTELILLQSGFRIGPKVQLVERATYSVGFHRKSPRTMEVPFRLEPISTFLFLLGFVEKATVSDARMTFAEFTGLQNKGLLTFRTETSEDLPPETALVTLQGQIVRVVLALAVSLLVGDKIFDFFGEIPNLSDFLEGNRPKRAKFYQLRFHGNVLPLDSNLFAVGSSHIDPITVHFLRSFKFEMEKEEFSLNLPVTETVGYAAREVEAVRMCAVKQLDIVKKGVFGPKNTPLEMTLPLEKVVDYLKICVFTEPSIPVEFAVLQSRFRWPVRLGETEERLKERLLECDDFLKC